MNTKMTVLWTVAFTLLFQFSAIVQAQWASGGYASLDMASQYGSAQVSPGRFAQRAGTPPGYGVSSVPGPSVMPASFYGTPACGVPESDCGVQQDACSGACGGACAGGCGSGLFSGKLGRACQGLGLGGCLGGGGMASGGGWFDVEYLLWWSKERYVPVLATESPAATPFNVAGRLGQPTTRVLFGDDMIGGGPYSGVRLSGGRWLDGSKTLGIGGRGFYVSGSEDFDRSSNGDPAIARPFYDLAIDAPNALLVAYPGVSHGSINIEAENELTGFDIFFRKLLLAGYCNRLDFIGGYQYTNLQDSVGINHSVVSDDPAGRVPLGTQVDTNDYYEVENQFHGGFVGVMGTSEDGPLSWNLLAKIGLGNMNQQATISGRTASTVPAGGGSFESPFGLLNLPSNIGSFDRDEFAIVPEINVTMGYNVTNNFKVTVGYTFMYWTKIALAGDLIDTTINSTQLTNLVGETRPRASLTSDGFFYTGLNIGGSLRF